MRTTKENNYAAMLLRQRTTRIRLLREQIAAGKYQLDVVHNQLMSGKLLHEEYLHLIDHRNNLIVSIEQKEQELAQVLADKKSTYERPKYNY